MKLLAFLCLSLGFFTLVPTQLTAQSIWETGEAKYGSLCTKNGIWAQLLNLILKPDINDVIEDSWLFVSHCNSGNGTVSCKKGPLGILHTCQCDQGSDAYYSKSDGVCLGKVGAHCNAEHSNFFPDKPCTPNADCVPLQGEGYAVGTCQCRSGYKESESDSKCVQDLDFGGDRKDPRTTTTTATTQRPPFKLQSFIVANATFNQTCGFAGLLNHTQCSTHSLTVACKGEGDAEDTRKLNKRCRCNMRDDSIFDKDLDMCVGRVGTWCLAREYSLGYKPCTKDAFCDVDYLKENKTREDYSFGICACTYGWYESENGSGTCIRNFTITNPSTTVPIVIVTTKTPTLTTPKPGGDGGNSGSRAIYSASLLIFAAISILH